MAKKLTDDEWIQENYGSIPEITKACVNCGPKYKFPEVDMIYDVPNKVYFCCQACANEHWGVVAV